MSVKTNIPQVKALIQSVEQKSGNKVLTHNAFIELVYQIEKSLNEHMSESTLERLWGYSTRKIEYVSLRTLDVLARYTGCSDWKEFCEHLKEESGLESEEIYGEHIDAASLEIGDELLLGWLPNRLIKVKYQGNHRFVVTFSENSSISPGDSFDCLTFQKGREMYLDHYMRTDSENSSRYVVGQKSGLTTVEIID